MKVTRRGFMKVAAIAGFPMIVPASVLGKDAPSNRITLGCIGMGSQGTHANLRAFLNCSDARVLAVCDVWDHKTQAARNMVDKAYKATGCKGTSDFREIIADSSIDAVVISTPDHWHVPISLMAVKAGKDVFCEKPTMTIAEGRELLDLVTARKAIFQMGMEDRSVPHYHKMVEWLRNGAIGELERVDLQLPNGQVLPEEEEIPVPKGLNYELFVGPAQPMPYTKNRTRQIDWRMTRNFGNGTLVDWGSHQMDTAQLAVNDPQVCPIEVEATGDVPEGKRTNVPVTFDARYKYSNGKEVRITSGGTGIRLTGTKGWVGNDSWRGQLKASDEKILRTKYTPETSKHWQRPAGEQRDFLDCIKSRKPTTYPADIMHKLHVSLHMGNIAIYLGRKLKWDPAKEEFINDDKANAMRSRKNREWNT